jgi:hypothetical protein
MLLVDLVATGVQRCYLFSLSLSLYGVSDAFSFLQHRRLVRKIVFITAGGFKLKKPTKEAPNLFRL